MQDDVEDADVLYKVVVNDDEQYSIWPVQKANPPGWQDGGKSGTKAECLAYISEIWMDMRPKNVRNQLKAIPKQQS